MNRGHLAGDARVPRWFSRGLELSLLLILAYALILTLLDTKNKERK
jgi:hypothetical protein